MTRLFIKPSEWLMLFAGVLMIFSVPLIMSTDSFVLWSTAKVFYVVGVVFLLVDH